MWMKHKFICAFVGGAFLGILVFLYTYGFKVLDVCYDDWLVAGGDLAQHYFGWMFYRNTPWTFPLGMTAGLAYPAMTSVMYTDSIPIFALIFKALSPILPETFQYFGLWGFFAFMMQGGLGALIVVKFTDRIWLCWICSLFFSLSPIMFQRMYGHTSLAGNFILLLPIIAWLYREYQSGWKKQAAVWCGMGTLAVLVHSYFVPMIALFFFGFLLEDLLLTKNWKHSLLVFLPFCFAVIVVMFALGAFESTSSFTDGGFGYYSSNLTTLFNPTPLTQSKLLPSWAIMPGQYEGFGYLGLGVLVLFALVIGFGAYRLAKRKKTTIAFGKAEICTKSGVSLSVARTVSVLVVGMLFFLYAISNVVTWSDNVLFTIPLPEIVLKLTSIFRASGRFIWGDVYIIITVVIGTVLKMGRKRVSVGVICVCVLLQAWDFSSVMYLYHEKYKNEIERSVTTFDSLVWEKMGEAYQHFVFLPTVEFKHDFPFIFQIANLAIRHKNTLNCFYFAKAGAFDSIIGQTETEYRGRIQRGEIDDDTLIFFSPKAAFALEMTNLHLYRQDGYILGVSKPFAGLSPWTPEWQIPLEQLATLGGQDVNGRRILHKDDISHGPYISLSAGTYEITVTGDNLDLGVFTATFDLGKNPLVINILELTSSMVRYTISLPTETSNVEFLVINQQEKEICMTGITLEKVLIQNQ
jgi:hypothetical protein